MVTSKVLYYPYIALPPSQWLIQMLLYWDKVGTITPYDFVQEPDRHEPFTRSLIREGLVQQVIPSWYLGGVPDFVSAFVGYLESLAPQRLDQRRRAFESTTGFKIHVEKLDTLEYEFRKSGLARPADRPWLEVEQETAKEFMIYLAAVLGRLPDLGYAPVTDDDKYLERFVEGRPQESAVGRVDLLRIQVLNDLLPGPRRPVTVEEIARFKDRHGDQLRRFRRHIEEELTMAADLSDEGLRQRRIELLVDGAHEEIREIQTRMGEAGWGEVVLGKLYAVLAAIPGVSPVFGLASTLYNAFTGADRLDTRSPYLYAAHVRELLGTTV